MIDLIKVELVGAAADRERVVSGPLESLNEGVLSSHGFDDLLFVVRARNFGWRTVEVVGWRILTSKGWGYSLEEFHLNPQLPHRLPPRSVIDFYVPMEQVFAASYASYVLRGSVRQIRGSIHLKSGAVRQSKMYKLPAVNLRRGRQETARGMRYAV